MEITRAIRPGQRKAITTAFSYPERGPPSEQDSVFHAKPVKVKRSPATGKLTQVNAENSDDVYRGKRREIVAEEIADDPDVYVDLPIDQVGCAKLSCKPVSFRVH